jgi:hypothetical protein
MPQSLKEITMALPRKQLVAVEDPPYYHGFSGCVGRKKQDIHRLKERDNCLVWQQR